MTDNGLTVLNNGASKGFDKAGVFKFCLPNIHVNKYLMGTILSLKYVANIMVVPVNMENSREKTIIVWQ